MKVTGSSFTGNTAKNAGGAIAACATSTDNTCTGSYDLFDIVAEGNTVSEPDEEKSGGGFAKFNGGKPVTLRRSTIIRSGSTLASSRTASRSDEENVQAPGGQRPQLNRSRTWRTSAPSSVEI